MNGFYSLAKLNYFLVIYLLTFWLFNINDFQMSVCLEVYIWQYFCMCIRQKKPTFSLEKKKLYVYNPCSLTNW